MKKRLLVFLQYLIFLGGGLALVWWQLSGMTAEETTIFKKAIKEANYWLVLPVVILALLSHFFRTLRWRLLMQPLDYRPSVLNTFCVTMVGYLANAAVPRLGEIAKCTLLAKHEKFKADRLIGTIVIERAFDLLCYLIFIVLTVVIQINVIGGYAKEQVTNAVASKGMPLWSKLLIIAACIFFFIVLLKWLAKIYSNKKIVISINNFFKGIKEGIITVKLLKQRHLFLVYTLLIWICYLLQIYIGFSAMQETQHLSIKAACSVLTLATLAMIATPNGVGSFPLAVMATLQVYGITAETGKAFGWLIWGVSTSIIIIFGVLCYLILLFNNKNNNEVRTIHT